MTIPSAHRYDRLLAFISLADAYTFGVVIAPEAITQSPSWQPVRRADEGTRRLTLSTDTSRHGRIKGAYSYLVFVVSI